MKIVYLGQFGNPFSDTTEKHIKYAFEMLGHDVFTFDDPDFHRKRNDILREVSLGADLFFFHKGGWRFKMSLSDIVDFLSHVTCPKAFWFFDKIADGYMENLPDAGGIPRALWIDNVLPFVNHGFVTDGTFVRQTDYSNIHLLRQGVGDKTLEWEGEYSPNYDIDLAFLGSIYGKREPFVKELKKEFGDSFQAHNNIFGKSLKDFCASCKILVAPKFPSDDFYWSSRIYQMLGNGGFLITPHLTGLDEEFEEGKHYVGYNSFKELVEKVKYYLEHEEERKEIQRAGYEKVKSDYKYSDRVKEMLDVITGVSE